MSKIVIKKRVNFEFLGDEYKDSYLNFKSIPVSEFDKITKDIEQLEKEKKGYMSFILNVLKDHFIDGKFLGQDLGSEDKDEIDNLDSESTIRCFKLLTGQELDPKESAPSTKQSTTEPTTT